MAIGFVLMFCLVGAAVRQIQVQVTDENDKPVPDLPIIFLLGAAGAGSLRSGSAQGASITTPTNAQGIATVQYNAGAEGNLLKFRQRSKARDFPEREPSV